MFAKMTATLAILVLLILNGLGNYWYTFGLWPKSWVAYVGFAATGITLSILLTAISKEK